MSDHTTIVWFRNDLRLADNGALDHAVNSGNRIVPVFIWSPDEEAPWAPGSASKWWLHQSLRSLHDALVRRGSRLVIRRGPAEVALRTLAAETNATAVLWNRCYEPAVIARDSNLKIGLREAGLDVHSHPGNLLFEPWTIANGSGKPFQVFTAFWRACVAAPGPPAPTAAPGEIRSPDRWPESVALESLQLEPKIDWAAGFRAVWQPGEAGAAALLTAFLEGAVADYPAERDRPDHGGTSRLSPHLHFGEISPRQVWHLAKNSKSPEAAAPYLRQIGWREFSYHLLFHFPHTQQDPLRAEFREFPWKMNELHLRAWTRGIAGYPLVDAGMRELWHTGWMHNRVRMVVASFLVKHLLIPWQEGAAWFWDTLVDADLANNTMGWQWTAGCGADAAPYFRIFNPVLQGEKFDPVGSYVRRWVPELDRLPNTWIHKPWQAPESILAAAGIVLGKTYPSPIVNHETAREQALAALASIKRSG